MADMVRVNTRVSKSLNDWLDKVSEEDGIPKSTLIMLSIEQYRQQREAVQSLNVVVSQMDEMKRKLDQLASGNVMES